MYGQGSFNTTSNFPPSGAPFPAGSANNGLSVDAITGKIVWGGEVGGVLANLLNNREIRMNGFGINFIEFGPFVGSSLVSGGLSGGTTTSSYGISAGNAGIAQVGLSGDSVVGAGFAAFISLQDGAPGGGLFTIRQLLSAFEILNNAQNRAFQIDETARFFKFGDIDNAVNGTQLFVNDLTQDISLLAANGIQTSTPGGGGPGLWKLGTVIVAASVMDATQYVEVNIGGVLVKLAMVV